MADHRTRNEHGSRFTRAAEVSQLYPWNSENSADRRGQIRRVSSSFDESYSDELESQRPRNNRNEMGRQTRRSRPPTILVDDTGQHKLQKQLESHAAEASKMQPWNSESSDDHKGKRHWSTSSSDGYYSDEGESQITRNDKNELGRQTQRSRSRTTLAADAGHDSK